MNTWNERYLAGDLPWDIEGADPHLVDFCERRILRPGRLLDVGCGTGTNALWLAQRGFEVCGIDIAPKAIEMAEAKRRAAAVDARFSVLDFLSEDVAGAPFDVVFDRGVLHVFDSAEDRARFAQRVAQLLAPGGQWLCLAGSTEGPARDHGPPRRTARDLMLAVEPVLELVSLQSSTFDADLPSTAMCWVMLSRVREVPAQPSTLRA